VRRDGFDIVSFLGVGSNMGDAPANCRSAFARIGACEGVSFLRKSSLYLTEPVGDIQQNWFVNAVCEIRTTLSPESLLLKTRDIERAMGRLEKGTGGPRTIDIDILLYGQEVIGSRNLAIPHAALHRRGFVLVPLNELAPYAVHPLFGISMRGLLDRLEDDKRVERLKEGDGRFRH